MFSSKNQLDAKLHLPRRPGFAGWKARVRDTPKARGANDAPRLAKVCMIEKIENLDPKLYADLLAQFSVLHDRTVSIVEPWPDDHIPAQAAKTRNRRKYRGIEPTIYAADDRDRSAYVRPERVGDACECAVRGYDVDRIAALRLRYDR